MAGLIGVRHLSYGRTTSMSFLSVWVSIPKLSIPGVLSRQR